MSKQSTELRNYRQYLPFVGEQTVVSVNKVPEGIQIAFEGFENSLLILLDEFETALLWDAWGEGTLPGTILEVIAKPNHCGLRPIRRG